MPHAATRRTGLGFVDPVTIGTGVTVGNELVSAVGNLFGGGQVDEYSGWQSDAVAGRIWCEAGRSRYDYPEGDVVKGETLGPYSVTELEAALRAAPEGSHGGPPGTVQGLVTAVRQPNPTLPAPRSLRELANMAVYLAHGRKDCVAGESEIPAAVHVRELVTRYRAGTLGPGTGTALELWGPPQFGGGEEELEELDLAGAPAGMSGATLALAGLALAGAAWAASRGKR